MWYFFLLIVLIIIAICGTYGCKYSWVIKSFLPVFKNQSNRYFMVSYWVLLSNLAWGRMVFLWLFIGVVVLYFMLSIYYTVVIGHQEQVPLEKPLEGHLNKPLNKSSNLQKDIQQNKKDSLAKTHFYKSNGYLHQVDYSTQFIDDNLDDNQLGSLEWDVNIGEGKKTKIGSSVEFEIN